MLGVIRRAQERRARQRELVEKIDATRRAGLRQRGIWLKQDDLGVWEMRRPADDERIDWGDVAFGFARTLLIFAGPSLVLDAAEDSIAGAAALAGFFTWFAFLRYEPTLMAIRALVLAALLFIARPKF